MINTKKLKPIETSDLIRIGRANDGGYVIPKKVFIMCDGLLSYGINITTRFMGKVSMVKKIRTVDAKSKYFTLIFLKPTPSAP